MVASRAVFENNSRRCVPAGAQYRDDRNGCSAKREHVRIPPTIRSILRKPEYLHLFISNTLYRGAAFDILNLILWKLMAAVEIEIVVHLAEARLGYGAIDRIGQPTTFSQIAGTESQ